jgi:hypothetical protein
MYPPAVTPRATLRGAMSFSMPQGDAGVTKTMNLIHSLVDQAIKDPYINRTAITILQQMNVPQYDDAAAARAIYNWVLRNIRYVKDPVGKETVRPANVILKVGAGDCDDINGVLIPSLLGTVGIPARGVTVAAVPGSPDFSHIYAEALINGQWTALDAARPHVTFGQAPEAFTRKAVWPLTGTEIDQVGGLAGMAALGDTATDWVTAIGQTAASLVSALNAPATAPTTAVMPGSTILTPSGAYTTPGTQVAVSSNISGNEILWAVGLIAAAMFLGRRR